nr:uncharacterized protein LOC111424158 [Onthophagus taurus]
MKTSILLITFLCGVYCELYTTEQQVFMKNFVKICQEATNTTTPMLQDFAKRKYSNDDVLKHFMFCFYKGLGIMKEDGSVDKEAFIKLSESLKDSAKTAAITCLDKRGANGPETAFVIAKCYLQGLPENEDASVIL